MVYVYDFLKANKPRDHTGKNLEFLYFNQTMNEDEKKHGN